MRSKYKLPYIGNTLSNYLYKNKSDIKLNFYTKNRSITLIAPLLKFNFSVHNGMKYYFFNQKKKALYKKLGEFVFTRKVFKFKRKKRK
jgi:ribosomal protein S19